MKLPNSLSTKTLQSFFADDDQQVSTSVPSVFVSEAYRSENFFGLFIDIWKVLMIQ